MDAFIFDINAVDTALAPINNVLNALDPIINVVSELHPAASIVHAIYAECNKIVIRKQQCLGVARRAASILKTVDDQLAPVRDLTMSPATWQNITTLEDQFELVRRKMADMAGWSVFNRLFRGNEVDEVIQGAHRHLEDVCRSFMISAMLHVQRSQFETEQARQVDARYLEVLLSTGMAALQDASGADRASALPGRGERLTSDLQRSENMTTTVGMPSTALPDASAAGGKTTIPLNKDKDTTFLPRDTPSDIEVAELFRLMQETYDMLQLGVGITEDIRTDDAAPDGPTESDLLELRYGMMDIAEEFQRVLQSPEGTIAAAYPSGWPPERELCEDIASLQELYDSLQPLLIALEQMDTLHGTN